MTVAATGHQGKAMEHLRNLISSSASLQSWLGVGSEVSALAYIFLDEVAAIPANGKYIVICPSADEEDAAQGSARGAMHDFSKEAQLPFELCGWRDGDTSVADQRMTHRNVADNLAADMLANNGTSGANGDRLNMTNLLWAHPGLSHEDETDEDGETVRKHYVTTGFIVTYGD